MKNFIKTVLCTSLMLTGASLHAVTPETIAKLEQERETRQKQEAQEKLTRERELQEKRLAQEKLNRQRETYAVQAQGHAPQGNVATLQGLPKDLRLYLLPFIMSGDVDTVAHGIFTAATISKSFHALINNPDNMIMILNAVPYKSVALRLRRKLRSKATTLPVLESPQLVNWHRNTYDHREDGQKLFTAAGGRPGLWMSGERVQDTGDSEEVLRLLNNKNIDLDWEDDLGRTPLIAAIYDGNTEIVKLLLDAGANLARSTRGIGPTPIIMAAGYGGKKEIVELLLKAKADPNAADGPGTQNSALSFAEDPAIKELLIRYGARE